MTLRPYQPSDALPLLALFRDTIRRVNVRDYNAVQIAAWASDDIDADAWAARFNGRFAIAAEDDGVLLGFADLEDDGHLDRFFVSADRQGCGVGRLLMTALLDEARRRGLARVYSEVSITARPFFERHGFRVLVEQQVLCRGVWLTNFRMEWNASIVLMLEDCPERVVRFREVLQELAPTLPLVVWRDANAFMREAGPLLPQAVLLSLDHDLEPEYPGHDPGDGYMVAQWLGNQPVIRPVIIHSSNGERASWMAGAFDLAGWPHERVVPSDDDWIGVMWWRAVRRLLRLHAKRSAR